METNIYIIVGKIIETVQEIEYNLIEGTKTAKILNLFERYKTVSPHYFAKVENDTKELSDAMGNMTFGMLMSIVRKHDFLPSDDLDYLESLLSKRNHLVHKFFKNNEREKTQDDIKIKYLNKFYEEACNFNQYLSNIIDEMKCDLDKYLH